MQSTATSTLLSRKLEDFGQLEARYKALGLAERAKMMLADADPALETADAILQQLSGDEQAKQLFVALRKNALLAGKMRPSEAKNLLMENGADFLQGAQHKLAAWRKTIERIAGGESIVKSGREEYIPNDAPLALAIIGSASVSNYLSIVQLAIMEASRKDKEKSAHWNSISAQIRRCATVLSDCENAATIDKAVR